MDAKNLGYSTKNIPLSKRDVYIKTLIQKSEQFLRRLRWKVFHFLSNQDNSDVPRETFGFRSQNLPPKNQLLDGFEKDMYHMIDSMEFRRVNCEFQKKLQSDLKEIRSSTKLFVKADKTKNMYEVGKDAYKKMLKDNITTIYKKCSSTEVSNTNAQAADIVEKLGMADRVQCIAEHNAFITIKDHKPGFPNEVKCRLLNPCKSEVGKISKKYLEDINKSVREVTSLNQWRNTHQVIEWFNGIEQKGRCKFVKFDIVSFYPSISEPLLKKALAFAKQHTDVDQEQMDTIFHARKSFLFGDGQPWVKQSNESFDVTEGSYDGAEVCELVGLFLLMKLQNVVRNGSAGCYRDDGLIVVKNLSPRLQDRLRKDIIQCFKDEGLQITIDINLRKTDFLDIWLDLANNKYYPYQKPGDNPVYVHSASNHPPNILKQIPKMTSKRLSVLSSNETEFNKVSAQYEEILRKSGYNERLSYSSADNLNPQRRRIKKVLWYNPPFDKQVKTSVGKTFL